MSRPAITVLMAVRDGLPFLPQALDSILTQSRKDFEFLIIDDGSTDRSREVVQALDDPRVRLLVNPRNLGLTRSLNLGLAQARGEYVARQDADDVSLPRRLEVQAGYLEEHPRVGLVAASVEYMDQEGRTQVRDSRRMGSGLIGWHLLFGNEIPHSGVMFRKDTVLALGGYDESLPFAQDYDLWSRLGREAGLVRLAEVLLRYRRHGAALSATRKGEQDRIRDRVSGANMARLLGREAAPETVAALRRPGREKGAATAAAGLIQELGRAYLESAGLSAEEAGEVRADMRQRLWGLAKSCLKTRPGEGLALLFKTAKGGRA